MRSENLCLRVSVPVCSFRRSFAREYLETERFPPPSTVYGFLLSLVGEEDRATYADAELALCVTGKPEVSRVLRTAWRVKSEKISPGVASNKRPDYQELLTGLEMVVWLRKPKAFVERVFQAFQNPAAVHRFGGLSLGESRDLVDEVALNPSWISGSQGTWLVPEPKGKLPLTVWVDHVGSNGTRWLQFQPTQGGINDASFLEKSWFFISAEDKEAEFKGKL